MEHGTSRPELQVEKRETRHSSRWQEIHAEIRNAVESIRLEDQEGRNRVDKAVLVLHLPKQQRACQDCMFRDVSQENRQRPIKRLWVS